MLILNKIKRIFKNERGGQFLEGGLWIVLVIFVVAIAGAGLATVVAGKFTALKDVVNTVSVPSLNL